MTKAEPRDWAFTWTLIFTGVLFLRPQDLIPPLEARIKSKKEKNVAISERALKDLAAWLENTSKHFSNTSA